MENYERIIVCTNIKKTNIKIQSHNLRFAYSHTNHKCQQQLCSAAKFTHTPTQSLLEKVKIIIDYVTPKIKNTSTINHRWKNNSIAIVVFQ